MGEDIQRKPARLTGLLLLLAGSRHPVSAEEIRTQVGGYNPGEDDRSFQRKLERDWETLAKLGIPVRTVYPGSGLPGADDVMRWTIDPGDALAADLQLSPREVAYLRVAAKAALDNPSFLQADALRLALNKLSDAMGIQNTQVGTTAAAAPDTRLKKRTEDATLAQTYALIRKACHERRRVRFGYTKPSGEHSVRTVQALRAFNFRGAWYLFALDEADQCPKDFRFSRMDGVELANPRAKGPEFPEPGPELEEQLAHLVKLPFQCSDACAPFEAQVLFKPQAAWKAESSTLGHGSLERREDGSVLWCVEARDVTGLIAWVVENGPGIVLLGPPDAVATMQQGLQRLAARGGGSDGQA